MPKTSCGKGATKPRFDSPSSLYARWGDNCAGSPGGPDYPTRPVSRAAMTHLALRAANLRQASWQKRCKYSDMGQGHHDASLCPGLSVPQCKRSGRASERRRHPGARRCPADRGIAEDGARGQILGGRLVRNCLKLGGRGSGGVSGRCAGPASPWRGTGGGERSGQAEGDSAGARGPKRCSRCFLARRSNDPQTSLR